MSEEQAKVKGVAFRTVGLCFAELRGGYRYHSLLASGWYPIALYREGFRAFCAFRAVRGDGPELVGCTSKSLPS